MGPSADAITLPVSQRPASIRSTHFSRTRLMLVERRGMKGMVRWNGPGWPVKISRKRRKECNVRLSHFLF